MERRQDVRVSIPGGAAVAVGVSGMLAAAAALTWLIKRKDTEALRLELELAKARRELKWRTSPPPARRQHNRRHGGTRRRTSPQHAGAGAGAGAGSAPRKSSPLAPKPPRSKRPGLTLPVNAASLPPPPGSPSTSRPTMEQLQMLLSVTRIISEGSRYSDTIQRVIDVATSVVNCDRVTLFIVSNNGTELSVAVSKGSMARQHMHMNSVTLPVDAKSIAGACAVTGESIIVDDAYEDSRFDKSVDRKTNYKTDTLLCVPLMDEDDQVIGVVQAVNKQPLPGTGFLDDDSDTPVLFTHWDRALLEHVADFAGNELSKLKLFEEMKAARARTEKMFELMRTISALSDVEEMMHCIIKTTTSLVAADRVTMYLVDESAQELIVTESRDLQGQRIPIQAGIAGHVARTGEPINIVDAHQDPRFDDTWDKRTHYRTASMMCLPVKDQSGSVVACLQAINKQGASAFTSTDLRCLEYMAGNAGIIIRKAQLMKKQERAQRATEALLDVVKLVSSDHGIHELVDGIIQAAYQLLQADMVTLFLVDPIKQELWMAVSKDMAGHRIPLGRGIVGHVAVTGQVVNVADAYEDARFDPSNDAKSGVRTKGVLCVPVCVTQGKPIAVIEAVTIEGVHVNGTSSGKTAFDDADVEALTAFSAEVALALNRKSVEAAFMKVLRDGKNTREQEFDVSLLTLYSDKKTSAKLHTSVRIASVQTIKPISWPVLSSPERSVPSYTSWSFDPFEQSPEMLLHTTKAMLDEFQVLARFNVPSQIAKHFLLRVQSLYRGPWREHATNAAMCLSRLDIFSVLIAALCHDIDHPGHTNAFEVNSMSELAIRHNDDAVLERHHAHTTFQLLLREPEAALFASLPASDLKQVRKNILEGILATDMSKHVRMCEVLVGKINKGVSSRRRFSTVHAFREALSPPSRQAARFRRRSTNMGSASTMAPPPFSKQSTQDRLLLIEALVHTGDLSGQCYPSRIARKWGERVIEEFTQQAEKEDDLDLPVMPFMKNLTRPLDRARLQLRFVNQVVLPLWTAMNDLLRGLAVPVDNLYNNRMLYQAEVDRYEAEIEASSDEIEEHDEVEEVDNVEPSETKGDEGSTVEFDASRSDVTRSFARRSMGSGASTFDNVTDVRVFDEEDEYDDVSSHTYDRFDGVLDNKSGLP